MNKKEEMITQIAALLMHEDEEEIAKLLDNIAAQQAVDVMTDLRKATLH